MKRNKVALFNVDVDALTMEQTVGLIDHFIQANLQVVHNCINANKVVLMEKDQFLRKSLEDANIISADGQAVVWASKLLGKALPERVPGIDLMSRLMELAKSKGYKVFLFGAKEEVVKEVSIHYNHIFHSNLIAGFRNGYFSSENEPEIVQEINRSGAQMLFVAIPSPEKELFISKYRHQMPNISLLMGVGGSFDVISGNVKRAPRWMQDNGLEWFYRLIQEPRKMWRRYLIGNWSYIRITLKALIHKGN